MTDKEVMKQALEALDVATTPLTRDRQEVLLAQSALRTAIEQAEKQEPVAWYDTEEYGSIRWAGEWSLDEGTPLYTAPPQHEWVGLTDEEYEATAEQHVTNCYFDTLEYARAIEAKLKEKNT